MAEEETSGRIEELKARLEADPESRVFYQLGEELRKSGRAEEAEQVLRQGLEKHASYLSALISLGRVLKDTSRNEEAVEILNRAFELDRQNVVVGRLLGEAYADLGEDVEAIKKYKLVAALHPGEEEIQEKIEELERRLEGGGELETPETSASAESRIEDSVSEEASGEAGPPIDAVRPSEESAHGEVPDAPAEPAAEPPQESEGASPEEEAASEEESSEVAREDRSMPAPETPAEVGGEADSGVSVRSEGEEPVGEPTPETPFGIDTEDQDETPFGIDTEDQDVSAPSRTDEDDVVATITTGDLYARQGHVEQAREVYRKVLARDPEHQQAKKRLESLESSEEPEGEVEEPSPTVQQRKVRRLEDWLSKVSRG